MVYGGGHEVYGIWRWMISKNLRKTIWHILDFCQILFGPIAITKIFFKTPSSSFSIQNTLRVSITN